VPAHLPAGSVLVDGKRSSSVTVPSAGTIDVALPARPRIMCDLIGPGTLTVSFTPAARIGNPKAAGSYLVRASRPSVSVSGRIAITH
jgi:hypothetical protein